MVTFFIGNEKDFIPIMQKQIEIDCPYCDQLFHVSAPTDNILDTSEIRCLPYSRDVGRFDPSNENSLDEHTSWSKIGKDFLRILSWENIGILRTHTKEINVYYKVHRCSNCGYLFDVFLNSSQDKLHMIWPHLFGSDRDEKCITKTYIGESWTTLLVEKFDRIAGTHYMGSFLMGLFLFMITTSTFMFSSRWDQFHDSLYKLYSTRIIATIGFITILMIIHRYVNYLRNDEKLKSLIKTKSKEGFLFWNNFTLSRFVGVQSENKFPSITQIDFVVGSITLIIMVSIWTFLKYSYWGIAVNIIFWSLIVGIFWIKKIYKTLASSSPQKRLNRINYWALAVLFLFIVLIVFLNKPINSFILFMNNSMEFFFWFLISFILGTGIWMSISTTVYVIKGLSKMPLNIKPYDRFVSTEPLRKIQLFSAALITTVFITITLIITIQSTSASTKLFFVIIDDNWTYLFMIVVIGSLFIFLGIGSKQYGFIYITLFYAILIYAFNDKSIYLSEIKLDIKFIVSSFFFTSLLLYQFILTEKIIQDLLRKSKESTIQTLSSEIAKNNFSLKSTVESGNKNRQGDKESKDNTYANLAYLTNVIKEIDQLNISSHIFLNISRIISPVLTTLLMEVFIKPAFKGINILHP